jgi:hypothetical protein
VPKCSQFVNKNNFKDLDDLMFFEGVMDQFEKVDKAPPKKRWTNKDRRKQYKKVWA